jgi:hypothetical protein
MTMVASASGRAVMRRLAFAPIKSGEGHQRAAAMAVVFDYQ